MFNALFIFGQRKNKSLRFRHDVCFQKQHSDMLIVTLATYNAFA